MKDRIYLKQWLELKPYEQQQNSDLFYLKVANRIYKFLLEEELDLFFEVDISPSQVKTYFCFIASYLEDLISETNLWNSFVSTHFEMYKRYLPFYQPDEYFQNELNPEDIVFLSWYYLNTVQKVVFVPPFHTDFETLANGLMEILDEEWDESPVNPRLQKYFSVSNSETDFFVIRGFVSNLIFKSYLHYPYFYFSIKQLADDLKARHANPGDYSVSLAEAHNNFMFINRSPLLSLTGPQIAANLLGKEHSLYSHFLNISKRISGLFKYLGQDSQYLTFEHLASARSFQVVKSSFNSTSEFKLPGQVIQIGFVRWMDDWWFSGMTFEVPDGSYLLDSPDKVRKAKQSIEFLDYNMDAALEALQQQRECFHKLTKGSDIVFLKADQINPFIRDVMNIYNETIAKSKKYPDKSSKQASAFGQNSEVQIAVEIPDGISSGLAFFNPKAGMEFAFDINSAFPLPSNPFFNPANSEQAIMFMLLNQSFSPELCNYCLDQCGSKLPFFTNGPGSFFKLDIDFLLRFWKIDQYHSTPKISFIW